MHTLWKLGLAAICVAGLGGTAVAASQATHVMNVALPDGSVARVVYAGNVAPRVTIAPMAPMMLEPLAVPAGIPIPAFAGMFEQMDREMAATMRQIDQLARQPLAAGAPGASLASYGDVPAGTSSYSVVTVSENGHQCSRSTQVIGQGAGKAPKVMSKVSGDCGQAQQNAPAVPTARGPIHQS